jgi:hypothetical protein
LFLPVVVADFVAGPSSRNYTCKTSPLYFITHIKNHFMHTAIQSIFAAVTLFSGLAVMSQEKTRIISGTVITFEESSPLEGVTILVKEKKDITGTMPDGTFSLPVSEQDTVIVASLPGYEPQDVKITNQGFYNIVLKKNTRGEKLADGRW